MAMKKVMGCLAVAAAINFAAFGIAWAGEVFNATAVLDKVPSTTYYVKCGPDAVVWLVGIKDSGYMGETFNFVQGGYIHVINSAKGYKEKSFIDDTSIIADHNQAKCVIDYTHKSHDRFVVRGQCGGSACPDSWDYSIINLTTLELEWPKGKTAKDGCDYACFTAIIGTPPQVYFGPDN